MIKRIPLEPAALKLCEESAALPQIYELPPQEGRQMLNRIQDAPVCKYPASVTSGGFDCGRWGTVNVYFISPETVNLHTGTIFYIHGAGWVLGNFHTHEKLVRELAARTNSIVVFPEYSLSPEAKYPTALEQCYRILCTLPRLTVQGGLNLNLDKLTIAGDSVGGNMAAALTLMSKYRNGPRIHKQLLYYPVTSACFCTDSYLQFAQDYYLTRDAMIWFWDQYAVHEEPRGQVTASPLKASLEQLRGLPDAMIITGEADVLRDEGEAYAAALLKAGVDVTAVRIKAIIHDFVMLNVLDQTNACRAAMNLSTSWINQKNECD